MEETVQTGLNMPTAVLTSMLFLSTAAVIIAFFYFRYRFQTRSLDTLQNALQSGSEMAPDIARSLEMRSDLRRGVVSLTRAAGCILFGLAIRAGASPPDAADALTAMWIFIGLSAFPGLFGAALIGFHLFESRSGE